MKELLPFETPKAMPPNGGVERGMKTTRAMIRVVETTQDVELKTIRFEDCAFIQDVDAFLLQKDSIS